jgi:hypothetical protein
MVDVSPFRVASELASRPRNGESFHQTTERLLQFVKNISAFAVIVDNGLNRAAT